VDDTTHSHLLAIAKARKVRRIYTYFWYSWFQVHGYILKMSILHVWN
jgi:hypothetical protein